MSTAAQLLVGGERISGESVRSQNGEQEKGRDVELRLGWCLWKLLILLLNGFYSYGGGVSG